MSVRDLVASDLFEGKLLVVTYLVLPDMDIKSVRCDVVYVYCSFDVM